MKNGDSLICKHLCNDILKVMSSFGKRINEPSQDILISNIPSEKYIVPFIYVTLLKFLHNRVAYLQILINVKYIH